MSTPLSTPIRQAKLGIASTKSLPLANEYKKLLGEQYQRLWLKHQQDLDLIDDIRSYVKSRLSIEREYTQALGKLSKQHISHINKRFTLLQQCDQSASPGETSAAAVSSGAGGSADPATTRAQNQDQRAAQMLSESEASDSRLQKRLANNGLDEPDKACTLYKVWSEHINRLQSSSKNRADQFEQLTMVVDKLKDIRSHKASIGKKCLDSHLRRIHEDILVSMVDVEKARKLYHEDESQAKKARENEEKIKKKRSGLLTKFTGGDLQAKKEKTSAQREANDIQSTQARNDYIMALAAANAHLQHYYLKDLSDFMSLIDDGVLDHCKIFMATLSECDINSLKDALHHAQYWSKMINLTGSQKTNAIFLDCDQSNCLRKQASLVYEPCNSDPISSISLEHNADYALQHEIDKWFTWFKKECRNLSQLIHQLERCQRALAEGQKSIELNGQTVEDLEPRIIELKQQIRKSEAAKHKAQARLRVIKEGGMQIEEWSVVESEIRADMARAQQELDARRLCEVSARRNTSSDEEDEDRDDDDDDGLGREASTRRNQNNNNSSNLASANHQVLLQISKDSDGSEIDESIHNLASVSRSTSNLMDKQQKAISGYSALTDPSLVWQDDYSNAWNTAGGAPSSSSAAVVSSSTAPMDIKPNQATEEQQQQRYNHLETSSAHPASAANGNANTVQSSSPLSAIMDGNHGLSTSPYQPMGEAYKSDYECDYNRTSGGPHMMNSAASSAEPYARQYGSEAKAGTEAICEQEDETTIFATAGTDEHTQQQQQLEQMLGQQVIALYTFDKANEDDLSFVEGDILRVLEINDSNWLQAKNEATGEQGFIPAPYVRLLSAEERQQEEQTDAGADFKYESYVEDSMNDGLEDEFAEAGNEKDREKFDGEGGRQKFAVEETVSRDEKPLYCRALYDYQPEADTYESDGLPHLALVQGELYRVLDQGEEDGWWLVEKDDGSATRGHVPSMLVEELEEGQETELGDEGDDDEEEADSREVSESSNYPEFGQPPPLTALPNIEPPKLEDEDQATESLEDSLRQSATNQQQPPPSAQTTSQSAPKTTDRGDASGQAAVSASLVPTSFIIIEPTPEVESRSIGENSKSAEATANDDGEQQQEEAPKGYSVVNEDFVLEGPSRKPSQLNDTHHEPLSGCDDSDIPAPPSVVIESFEVEKHYSSDDDDQPASQDESQNHNTPKEIRHTGNVDVNPMLRLRAEEFTKQIIAEALEMTQNVTSTTTRGEINNHEIRDYRYGVYNGRDLDHEEEDEEDEEEEVNQ